MTKVRKNITGLLAGLRSDTRGNVLAITAASMIPLAAMVGGGLDISRGYLAKTRLQQACDAGVLAGRKVMGTSGVVSTAVTNEVTKYVNFNYPTNYLGSTALTITPTLGTNDQIVLSLSTTVPTAVMKIFSKDTIAVTANCSARNDYSNIDIVLVLDTTGSMACKPERDSSSCTSWINSWFTPRGNKTLELPNGKKVTYVEEETSGSTNISRMQGLRDALANLQTQMATIESQFNMTEMGKRKRVRWSIIPFSQMVNAGFSENGDGTTLQSRKPTWFNTTGSYKKTSGTSLQDNNNNISHDQDWLDTKWDGCVEEQSTSNSITSTSSTIPSTAYDLLFDTVPNSTAKRWTVADPSKTGSAQYACPKAMRELQQFSATDFNNYFAFNQGFIANGGTYLDVGLLWAARLLSRTGNWSAENPELYHTYPVNRYVIFMTDGEMDTGNTSYSAYAQEYHWKRITSDGNTSTNETNHTARMLITCTAIKNMGVKIYAVSFGSGSTLSSDLVNCSSSTNTTTPDFAYRAADSAGLNAVFRNIGENIGSLRLSQ